MFSVDPIEQALSMGTDFVVAEMAPTLDQVSVTSEQHAIVWRRSTMGAGGFYSDRDAACLGFIERPKLSKDCDSAYDRDDDCFTKNCESLELAFRGKSPPAKPLWLPKTYFYSSDSIGCLVASVQQVLDCIGDLECDFSRESFTWNGLFLRGSSHCRMEVSIYTSDGGYGSDAAGTFIVEAHRLSGDCRSLLYVFNHLKRLLSKGSSLSAAVGTSTSTSSTTTSTSNPRADSVVTVPSFSLPACEPPDEAELFQQLQPVLRMVGENTIDAKIEASKILCELAQNELMQNPLCESECLKALVELASTTSPEVARLHAVVAVGHLSLSMACQQSLIDSGILPVLLSIASDNSCGDKFDSRELRREAARIIANISARFGAEVVVAIGKQAMSSWVTAADDIADEKLRLQTRRARDAIAFDAH